MAYHIRSYQRSCAPPTPIPPNPQSWHLQVAVSVLCIAGPVQLVHIFPISSQSRAGLSIRLPFATEVTTTSISPRHLLPLGTMDLSQSHMLNGMRPGQAQDLAVAVPEVSVSILVKRTELVRLFVTNVSFGVNFPYRAGMEHHEQDERLFRKLYLFTHHTPS